MPAFFVDKLLKQSYHDYMKLTVAVYNNNETGEIGIWTFPKFLSKKEKKDTYSTKPHISIMAFYDVELPEYIHPEEKSLVAVRFSEIKKLFGKRFHEALCKFMHGQTMPIFEHFSEFQTDFLYVWDFQNFLKPAARRFFD